MAPREPEKVKNNTCKAKPTAVSVKKTPALKNTITKVPSQKSSKPVTTAPTNQSRLRTNTVPKVSTPKPKENKSVPNVVPGSVTKSGKKKPLWKRKPLPAHSGVPMPEKMKKLHLKLLQAGDDMLLS